MVSKVEDYKRITGNDIIAMRQGDSGPINQIRSYILGLSLKLTRNGDLAEDLTQETLLRIWERGSSYDPGKSPVTWINTVTRRLWFDTLRKMKARSAKQYEPDNYPSNDPSETLEDEKMLFRRELDRVLQENSLGYEELDMTLRGINYEEIAYSRKIPKGTVKSRTNRAREDLRGILLDEALSD